MTNAIVMLILMTAPWLLARALSRVARREIDTRGAAAVGAAFLFTFTSLGHFIQTELMSRMLPPWIPGRVALVQVTGLLELAIAAGFLVPRSRRTTGWIAVGLLVAFFPVNAYAAFNHIPMGGHAWGPAYLLVRAPLQAFIVFWVYWFTIRQRDATLHGP